MVAMRSSSKVAWFVFAAASGTAAAGGDDGFTPGTDLRAGPPLPVSGLYASTPAALLPTNHRMNFDLSAGPYIPIEGPEDYDVGGTIDMKLQGEVVRYFFVGGEFAYAGHGVNDAGRLWFDGSLHRFFFLIPLEVDLPFYGVEDNPFSVRFGIAPGMQVVDPVVDHRIQRDAEDQGFHIDEDTFVAFDLRLRVGLRLPMDPHFGFLIEGAYDWSEATGKVVVEDFFGGTRQTTKHHVNLSGVSVLLGIEVVW